MKIDNPFDRKLEVQKRMPDEIRTAAVALTDTLDLCWAAVQAVFEKRATPEHALALLPMFMARSDAIRQQEEAAYRQRADAASRPTAATKRRGKGPTAD